jgi:hypothetical protein
MLTPYGIADLDADKSSQKRRQKELPSAIYCTIIQRHSWYNNRHAFNYWIEIMVMCKTQLFRILLFLMVLLLIISSCSSESANNAPGAVEAYLGALVTKDENQMINQSCADWESQAKLELNSFAAVEASLENLNCEISGQAGDYILVDCRGIIIANYGAEVLEIDLQERTFQVLQEGDEWRMCGYR